MTAVVTLKKSNFVLPSEICRQARLHRGEKVLIETFKDGSIQIKHIKGTSADARLKKLLKRPYHMGKVLAQRRQDIYCDIA